MSEQSGQRLTWPRPSEQARHWALDPDVVYLNHGSFGACPRAVLEAQQHWRLRMEREPVQFFTRQLEPAMDATREALAGLIGCDGDGLVMVPNATIGVATVLANAGLGPGDEVVITDHEYPACRNNVAWWARRAGARVVVARVPIPLRDEAQAVEALLDALSPRTRLVLVSHITSPTAIVMPIEAIVAAMRDRGVPTLVDGAHAPAAVPLNLSQLRPAWYVGNCHKWLCAPKGAALLYVQADRRAAFRPLVLSNRADAHPADRSQFLVDFGFVGTQDYTAALAVPAAIELLESLDADGLPGVMRRNRELVLNASRLLEAAIGATAVAPPSMTGPMVTLRLPSGTDRHTPTADATGLHDPLQDRLLERYRIEVPVWTSPAWPGRFLRISAQRYNCLEQYEYLASALEQELGRSL